MISRRRADIPELLAPAGGKRSLIAAVNNGADAVYLGLSSFNARRGAENFDLESLRWACDFAHLRGVRVYLTANVVVMPDEMAEALSLVAKAWSAGVDAVIVQDLGLARVLRDALPDIRLHASTQIDAHDPATVRGLARLGFARVTLARETPLDRIAAIVEAGGIEVESFVHGALCFSYSGQCLLSSAIGGRSANRGMCAQPCRLPHELIVDGSPAKTPGRYLLSPKDLAAIERLPELVSAGVSALKIEGRAKAPEYVAVVTSVYRAALDRLAEDPDSWSVLPAESEMLEEAFSRGFTDAYLDGRSGNEMMAYLRPNNRGAAIGRVAATDGSRATIALERALDADDVVEFWTARGHHAQRAGQLEVRGAFVRTASAGERAVLSVEKPVAPGDRVFRVSSATLIAAARRTFEPASAVDARATDVDVSVRLTVGQPARVSFRCGEHEGSSEGPIVETARTRPVSVEDVVEHVGRMGGTGYRPRSWDVEIDSGAGIGFSVLHRLRREALEKLDESRLRAWRTRSVPSVVGPPPLPATPRAHGTPELAVVAWTREQAQAALEAGADAVFVRVARPEDLFRVPAGAWPAFPRVTPQNDIAAAWLGGQTPARALAGTLGMLSALADAGSQVEADWPLNAMNQWTAATLSDLGASRVWLSPELPGALVRTAASASPKPVGVLLAGRLELMVAEHCVLAAAGRCAASCDVCATRSKPAVLRDRKGFEMPVFTDSDGRSHVYNAVPLDLVRVLDEVVESGASAVRLDVTIEPPAEVRRLVSALRAALDTNADPATVTLYRPSTTGHYFRRIS
ncbi:collagenase and related proteases [Coriobacteriaceae bacterium EMTCatB1]|nr:collagenase and related proteases [Coriobacteriaceae bacterium EMTCatB1]